MATEAQRRATVKYDAKNTKQYHLKLNLNTDADIIEWLDQQPSMQGYIKELIRKDMGRATCQENRAESLTRSSTSTNT